MRSLTLRYATGLIAFFMSGAVAFCQSDSLALSSGAAPPGGTVSLNLSLNSPSGSEPAGIQWTYAYSPSDIVAISAIAGAAATAAGKSLSCAGSPGSYTCLVTGLNANVIQNGVVAVVTATLSPATSGTAISVTNALSASAAATAIPTTATGGTIAVGGTFSLTSLICNPGTLASGASTTCTVTLSQAAPAGGSMVALSGNGLALTVPAWVTVPANGTSATFTATAGTITTNQTATVTATLSGASQSATLSLTAAVAVSALACNPGTITPPASSICTVTLNQPAPSGGSVLMLSDTSASLIIPATVTVPAGATATTFSATASSLTTSVTVTLTAALNAATQTASLLMVPMPAVSSLVCEPTSVTSGGSSTCTVTLSSQAVASQTVQLTANSSVLTLPASVPVPAGATSGVFTATAGIVTTSQSVIIAASLNTGSFNPLTSVALNLSSLGLAALSCDPTSIIAGSTSTCTVTLSAPAPAGGVSIAVSSGGPALSAPASLSVASSSSTATFAVTAGSAPATGQSSVAVTAALYGASQSVPLTVTICPCSVLSAAAQPANPDSGDSRPIEVGMMFVPEISGYVTGVRFFKALNNTGTHVGNLWLARGKRSVKVKLLATVTFTNETSSGWQLAYFPSPVAVIPDDVYVISYNAPNGHYAADGGFFTNVVSNPPLFGLADRRDEPNGVYTYGSSAFPASGASATNFWVDPIFNTSPAIGTATPASLWTSGAVPKTTAASTSQPAQLGVTFISDVPGYVTGIRYYKSSTNRGRHLGYLWTSTGTLLASVVFTNESDSGWQQANFATPVVIDANSPYVISYWSPEGWYADDAGYFATSGIGNQMLHAPPDGQYGPNGSYAPSDTFPAGSSNSSNHWVDVVLSLIHI